MLRDSFGLFGLFGALVSAIGAIVTVFIVAGIIVLLVRFLLVGTQAAQLYIAKNGPLPPGRGAFRSRGFPLASPVSEAPAPRADWPNPTAAAPPDPGSTGSAPADATVPISEGDAAPAAAPAAAAPAAASSATPSSATPSSGTARSDAPSAVSTTRRSTATRAAPRSAPVAASKPRAARKPPEPTA